MTDNSHNPGHVFVGIKWALVSMILLIGGISQALFGWAGNSLYMRSVYPILALVMACVFALLSYAFLNQPALRRKEEEAAALKQATENK